MTAFTHTAPRPHRAQGLIAAAGLSLVIGACSDTTGLASAPVLGHAPAATELFAPAGRYALDPTHAVLEFRINHLGLSNYVARFTRFDIALELDPDDLAASSVEVTIDPASIRTDYPGDFQSTHPDSPFSTFDEELAQSADYFNAGQHPRVTFQSTQVEQTAPGRLRITGDLNLLGITREVTLDGIVVGSVATHPFIGRGAIGFAITGAFERSDFGMTHLLDPPLLGDTVTIQFDGELLQADDTDA